VTDFTAGEQAWIERTDSLRTVVRQELIARQLAPFVRRGMTVLDVGCGQGTQALRLAASGCRVTGVDPSADLLGRCGAAASAAGVTVDLVNGRIEELDQLWTGRTFDLVCCHGVLMYLDDRTAALAALAGRVGGDGYLSVTFRNGHGLAMRPGLRRDWATALAAFDSDDYVNELGLRAGADRLPEVTRVLDALDLDVVDWFGVRVFTDASPADGAVPDPDELTKVIDAEERAGATDPYRWLAAQLHVVAGRAPTGPRSGALPVA